MLAAIASVSLLVGGIGIMNIMLVSVPSGPEKSPISSTTILVAVGFSSAAAIVFGYYPASRAAALDPIEAPRFE